MATILLTWELGGGLGHLVNLKPFAQDLARSGHRVYAALRDLSRASLVFADDSIQYVQAPVRTRTPPDQIEAPHTFAHLLHNVAFSDEAELAALCEAWTHLFDHIRPDLAIFDHSPTALLASRGQAFKRVLVGTGFFCPPNQYPLPDLRPPGAADPEKLRADEDQLLARMNRVLAERSAPPLSRVAQLYADAHLNLLATFPELDHYPDRKQGNYIGAWHSGLGSDPVWPEAPGRRIYAYLKPFPALEGLLEILKKLALPTLIYVDGIDRAIQQKHVWPTLRFLEHPLDLRQVGRQCDLAILNANHGTSVAMLFAGRPILQIPLHLEQWLFAAATVRLGAGLSTSPSQPSLIHDALAEMLSSHRFAQAAQRFALRYQQFDPQAQTEQMLAQVEDLLADRAPRASLPLAEPATPASSAPIDPRTLVHGGRFDLFAKTIYARHRLLGVEDRFARGLYLQHIHVLNGFHEIAPIKRGPDDFLVAFNRVIDSIREKGFDPHAEAIPLGSDGVLINGAHRLAACIALNKPACCMRLDRPGYEFGATWFRQRTRFKPGGLPTWCGDAMALEYCRLAQRALMLICPPNLGDGDRQIIAALRDVGRFVYGKRLPDGVLAKLLHELSMSLPAQHAEPALGQPNQTPARVFLLEPHDGASLGQLRALLDERSASLARGAAIIDDEARLLQAAQLTFNDNSLRRLKHAPLLSSDGQALLQRLERALRDQGIDPDLTCLVGDSPRAVCTGQAVNSAEIVLWSDDQTPALPPNVRVAPANSSQSGKSPAELIFDPRNHGYACGIKFDAAALPTTFHAD